MTVFGMNAMGIKRRSSEETDGMSKYRSFGLAHFTEKRRAFRQVPRGLPPAVPTVVPHTVNAIADLGHRADLVRRGVLQPKAPPALAVNKLLSAETGG